MGSTPVHRGGVGGERKGGGKGVWREMKESEQVVSDNEWNEEVNERNEGKMKGMWGKMNGMRREIKIICRGKYDNTLYFCWLIPDGFTHLGDKTLLHQLS